MINENYIWICLAIAIVIVVIWVKRYEKSLKESVQINDQYIRHKKGKNISHLRMEDIIGIQYHYSAVTGYIGTWEFKTNDGGSLFIDKDAEGVDRVLVQLENELPYFSLKQFKVQFEAGDVEDTIDVWRRT